MPNCNFKFNIHSFRQTLLWAKPECMHWQPLPKPFQLSARLVIGLFYGGNYYWGAHGCTMQLCMHHYLSGGGGGLASHACVCVKWEAVVCLLSWACLLADWALNLPLLLSIDSRPMLCWCWNEKDSALIDCDTTRPGLTNSSESLRLEPCRWCEDHLKLAYHCVSVMYHHK